MGVAMGFSGTFTSTDAPALDDNGNRPARGFVATPRTAGTFTARDESSRGQGGLGQARHTAHVAAFLCHALAGEWDGHPHLAGFAGPSRRRHDADLYACDGQARPGCA